MGAQAESAVNTNGKNRTEVRSQSKTMGEIEKIFCLSPANKGAN